MRMWVFGAGLLFLVVLTLACSSATPTAVPTATPISTPPPSATAPATPATLAPATTSLLPPTPVPTSTSAPASTPVPTSTSAPASTPVPTATVGPEPTPTQKEILLNQTLDRIADTASLLRGLDQKRPTDRTFLERNELQAYLLGLFEEEDVEEIVKAEEIFSILGLIPDDLILYDLYIDLFSEQLL